MFIQVIQGTCHRHDEARELLDRWLAELAPGAEGWLGGTYGFTDDDDFLAVIRFESREKAMANSARPETDAMSKRMAELMDAPPEFHDCDDVTVWGDGGSDDAGFVQVIQGRTDDLARLKQVMSDDSRDLSQERPDIIGGTFAVEEDGSSFINTVAFTDEASAREGEKSSSPPEEMQSLMSDLTFYDLRDPWFESA